MSSSVNNTRKVLKIRETFSNLQAKKIKSIQKIINKENKPKPRLNMMTKGPSRKQVIVPISNKNKNKFISDLSAHISNINRALKNIKSEVKANFVQAEQAEIIIVTNKVVFSLDLQTMEQYIKNMNQIEAENVEASQLPQSKSYFKIIGISYLLKNTNTLITLDVVETIIKNNHIFNNVAISSKPKVIKVLLKSDMAIIWLDIWDIQSSSKAKDLINKCFNIRSYIATI